MIRHVVLCRFRADVAEADKVHVYAALGRLGEVVPGILGASFGSNVSPEGVAQGFDDGFVIDFADAAARDAYLVHPDHVVVGAALVALLDRGLDGLVVFDIEVVGVSEPAGPA